MVAKLEHSIIEYINMKIFRWLEHIKTLEKVKMSQEVPGIGNTSEKKLERGNSRSNESEDARGRYVFS